VFELGQAPSHRFNAQSNRLALNNLRLGKIF
jgi:hypothetical protein